MQGGCKAVSRARGTQHKQATNTEEARRAGLTRGTEMVELAATRPPSPPLTSNSHKTPQPTLTRSAGLVQCGVVPLQQKQLPTCETQCQPSPLQNQPSPGARGWSSAVSSRRPSTRAKPLAIWVCGEGRESRAGLRTMVKHAGQLAIWVCGEGRESRAGLKTGLRTRVNPTAICQSPVALEATACDPICSDEPQTCPRS